MSLPSIWIKKEQVSRITALQLRGRRPRDEVRFILGWCGSGKKYKRCHYPQTSA